MQGFIYQLSIQRGPNAGQMITLGPESLIIGRHSQAGLTIYHESISRQHARLTFTPLGCQIEDLGSANGTFVNGRPVSGSRPLNDGDLIQLGQEVDLVFKVIVDPDNIPTSQSRRSDLYGDDDTVRSTATQPVLLRRQPDPAPADPPAEAAPAENKPRNFVKGCLTQFWAIIGVIATCGGLIVLAFVEGPEAYRVIFNPPPCQVAARGETLILVADFDQAGVKADTRIFRALNQRVSENNLSGIRVQRTEGEKPRNEREANDLGKACNATMVIWGFADSFSIEPNLQMVEREDVTLQVYVPGGASSVDAADVPTFSTYVSEDVPHQFDYLMLFALGQIAYFSGDNDQAIVMYDQALAIDLGERATSLDVDVAYYYRGLAYRHLGSYDQTVADFTQSLALNPDRPPVLLDRGFVYSLQGNFGQAMADFDRIIELDPDYDLAYNNRAYTRLLLDGDVQESLADIERAFQLSDKPPGSYFDTRGHVYYRLGDYAQALADFEISISMGETFSQYGLGLVYEAQGQTESAIDAYRTFLQYHADAFPESDDARQHLAALGG